MLLLLLRQWRELAKALVVEAEGADLKQALAPPSPRKPKQMVQSDHCHYFIKIVVNLAFSVA